MSFFPLRRLVSALGLLVALTTALSIPAGYAAISYKAEADRHAFEARLNASRIARYIYQHGAMWPYHRVRLAELIELTADENDAVKQRVFTSEGKLVLEEGPALATPTFTRSAPIFTSSVPVGHIEIEASARPLLRRVALVACFSFALGLLAYFGVRMLPLKVLDRTIAALSEREQQLSRTTIQLQDALGNMEQSVRERTVELEQARDAADEANRAKTIFLANMSHELRTPLNAIIGYSALIMEEAEAGGGEQCDDVRKINSAGTHLLGLIEDVLDLSKIEAGKMDLHHECIALPSLLTDVVETCRTLAAKNGNNLELVVPQDVATIVGDGTKLRQVILNLLSNACKFTHQGEISLAAVRDGEWIRFDIRDTGIGIAPENLEKLFSNFTQVQAKTSKVYGGTGLGLALSQKLCRLMGGEIFVTSRLGEGSCFTVRLPLPTGNAALAA